MFCIKYACLVDEEHFLFSLVSGSDGGTAIGDGTDLELHFWVVRGSLQNGISLQGTIDLIVIYLCVAGIVAAEDGRFGDIEGLAIDSNRDLRNCLREHRTHFGKEDSV